MDTTPKEKKPKAKVLGFKQMKQKKHDIIEGLDPECMKYFGELEHGFRMIVWGLPKGGKSNLVMQFIKWMMAFGRVLYVSLEEGFSLTMKRTILRHLDEEKHGSNIEFADHNMTYEMLFTKLSKKKSPRFIVIDSLQYWGITIDQYRKLSKAFPSKSFIMISHAQGNEPKGALAKSIRHDVGIAVHVKWFIAFIESRYGGLNNLVIWLDGAKKKWGKRFKKMVS